MIRIASYMYQAGMLISQLWEVERVNITTLKAALLGAHIMNLLDHGRAAVS